MITSLSRYTLYFTAALVSERVKPVKGRGGGLNSSKEAVARRISAEEAVHLRGAPIRGGMREAQLRGKPKQKRGILDPSRPPAGGRRLRQPGDKGGAGNHQHEQWRNVKIYQVIARRIEDNFARRERGRKTKKESKTIKTNITAIDKKYLVVNLPELNIYPVDGGDNCP